MTSEEIRKRFLDFFQNRGHALVPSSSLVPENDPTTLFTGSGMQPMVPYLLGQPHSQGTRLTNSQKCFRSVDIDEIGDNRHTTFFEMLGNWSLGDYFKEEQLAWIFSFLVDELGIDPHRLYVSTFIGDEKNNLPRDTESAAIWKKLFLQKDIEATEILLGSEEAASEKGMQDGRIFYYDTKKNWWSRAGIPENMPVGEPGGPDTEMFYEFTHIPHDPKFGANCHPNCDCGRFLEIGNNVFMEYVKNADSTFSRLPKQNVDFGGGLERMGMAVQNTPDIFLVNHLEILNFLQQASGKKYRENENSTKSFRIIADHIKAAVFLIGDGVLPANSDQGYFVRRLLRRAIVYFDKLGIQNILLSEMVEIVLEPYKNYYIDIYPHKEQIKKEIDQEEAKFRKVLQEGLKQFEKVFTLSVGGLQSRGLSSEAIFNLVTTYGFPFEMVKEIAKERGLDVDEFAFEREMKKHKETSRAGAEQKFKGGLGDTSEISIKYHTATHLLHQALRDVLGEGVEQKGSNITPERLRFDFSYPVKMSEEEKERVETIVNEKIKESLPVNMVSLPKAEAEKVGALHFFGDKYGEQINVYYIGDSLETAYSKEFCGGPHVRNTSELGIFKIIKEEAVSAGVRRIKAVLE